MSEFVEVAKADDLKEGEGRTVEVKGTQVALFKKGGKFYAINNTCLHEGGPLGEGSLDGDFVVCPLHGWKFNIKTGAYELNPKLKVANYRVKVESGRVLVSLD